MQSKGLVSFLMVITLGILSVSVSTSMARPSIDSDARHTMEEVSLIMDAAAEQELSAKAAAGGKHLLMIDFEILYSINLKLPTN